MDTQDVIKLGRKAKNETESFINRHLNDQAKGWPRLCLCRSRYPTPAQPQQARTRNGCE
jgi:hypothetical protein